MGAVIYFSFILLVFMLSRAARPKPGQDLAAIAPEHIPLEVSYAARGLAKGLRVEKTYAYLDADNALRYQYHGRLPDLSRIRLEVKNDLSARLLEQVDYCTLLPEDLRLKIKQFLPSYHIKRETLKLVSKNRSLWYELRGVTNAGHEVCLAISQDGQDLVLSLPQSVVQA